MTSNPLVSVVLPVFNGERFLKEAIESVLVQTYANFELLIINDGSTDNSEGIIKSYRDPRIRLISNEVNLKLIATLNKGIVLSRGKYIARMDADDICHRDRIEKQVRFMEKEPLVIVCGTWFQTLGFPQGDFIEKLPCGDLEIRSRMFFSPQFAHPSVMIRRAPLIKYHLRYNHEFVHAEDFEFWVSLSRYGLFANLPEPLLIHRFHENQISEVYAKAQRSSAYKVGLMHLESLGIAFGSQDSQVFQDIFCFNFKSDPRFIKFANSILSRLLLRNERQGVFLRNFFSEVLALRFFLICSHFRRKGFKVGKLWFLSDLRKHARIPLLEELFFSLSILKHQLFPQQDE